jgi:hypothetical protein
MPPRRIVVTAAFGFAAAIAAQALTPPWADANYRYRRPLTISNNAGADIKAGDVLAYSFVPAAGPFDSKAGRKDVKIYYQPGSDLSVKDVKQVLLDQGAGSAKVLFSAKDAIAPGKPLPFIKGTDSSTFAETGAATGLAGDDAVGALTLPFSFPFLGGSYTKALISTNGWISFDTTITDTHYGDPQGAANLKNALQGHTFIAPLGYDQDLSGYVTGAGVFVDSGTAGQVTIRWKSDAFTDNSTRPARLNYSVTLFQDGRIRFNYGSVATIVANDEPSYDISLGIADGNVKDDLLQLIGVPLDLSNHAPILYTPNAPSVSTDANYYVYYSNPAETGARDIPDSANLQAFTFDAGVQGWTAVPSNPDTLAVAATVQPAPGSESVLEVSPGSASGKPFAYAAGSPDLLEQTIYAKIRPSGAGGVAIAARAGADNHGYALVLNDLTGVSGTTVTQAGLIVRTSTPGAPPDYAPIGTFYNYTQAGAAWNFAVLKVTGSGASTDIQGKAFSSGGLEPRGFQYEAAPADAALWFGAGKVGLTGSGGGGSPPSDPQADWIYVAANGFADSITATIGADATEEELPKPPGKAVLKGFAIDAATTGPIPRANITVTPTGGGTPLVLPPTNTTGAYQLYLDPGTYTIAASAVAYTTATYSVTLTADATTVQNLALVAPELVTNGGFETPDPAAPALKPLGWYRRDYLGSLTVDPNAELYAPGWRYISSNAHSGSRAVEIVGPYDASSSANLAWEPEGSTPGAVNTDNRGAGPTIPEVAGGTYRITAWVKKTQDSGSTLGGRAILRIRPDLASDDPSSLDFVNAGLQLALSGTFDWTKISYDYTVPAEADNHFLQIRLYGTLLPAGNHVYWDDVSVHRIQLPVFRGTLHTSPDSAGNVTPLGNYMVGVRESATNGLNLPITSTNTDALGNWSLSFEPQPGTSYVVQAYPDSGTVVDHVLASKNVPLQPATSLTEIVYDQPATVDIALGKPVVAFSSILDPTYAPENLVDGINPRWASDATTPAGTNPRGYDHPQFVVLDLGQTINYKFIDQIILLATDSRPDHYQLRVSDTPPPTNPDDFTYTQAAVYGSLLYDSGQSIGNRFHATPTFVAYTDIVGSPALQPVSGRYLEIYLDKYLGFGTHFDIYELKVESLPVTIQGKVVDKAGNPVAGAYVGVHPDGNSYALTDEGGVYRLQLPRAGSYRISAHKPGAGNTVIPVSAAYTIIPGAGTAGPTLVLGDSSPNLVTSASSDRPDLTTAANPPALAGDSNFTTHWESDLIGDASPAPVVNADNPVHITTDLGSVKTVNQAVVSWYTDVAANHNVDVSGQYSIDLSTDGANYTSVYQTANATGGYPADLPDGRRQVDAISFAAQSARFVRLTLTGHKGDYLGIWEVQAANVAVATPVPSVADVQRALQIAAGLTAVTPADLARLDRDGDQKITILDAVRIDRGLFNL